MLITWMRSYLAVVAEGSINLAAARLRITQPALSRQIRALEHEVGATLLERGAKGVRPTEAGAAFGREAALALAACDRALAAARARPLEPAARLRVGYLQSAARALLTPALAELRRRHPGIRAELRDLSPGEQIDALRAGTIDLALTGQEGAVLGRDFHARTLARLPVLAALPEDHPLAEREALDLKELRRELYASFPEEDLPGRNTWVTQLARRAGFRPRRGPRADDIAHLFGLIAAEGVVTLLPGYFKDEPHPGVRLVPLASPSAEWELTAMWRREAGTAAPIRTLLDALGARTGTAATRSHQKPTVNRAGGVRASKRPAAQAGRTALG